MFPEPVHTGASEDDPLIRAEVGWGAPRQGILSIPASFFLLPLISFRGSQWPSPVRTSQQGQPMHTASGGTGKGREGWKWIRLGAITTSTEVLNRVKISIQPEV